jgi:hypothetical protein
MGKNHAPKNKKSEQLAHFPGATDEKYLLSNTVPAQVQVI